MHKEELKTGNDIIESNTDQQGPKIEPEPNTFRKLATIRRVDDIRPIEGADLIQTAIVGGWKVIIKKGEYEIGDLAIYCEIDSWIPHKIAPFLSKGQEPNEYNNVKGERLRTIKMKGQLSQGLLLSPSILEELGTGLKVQDLKVNDDVTKYLGIQKWERQLPLKLVGLAKGLFPNYIPKTDQERIQNLVPELEEWKTKDWTWEVTEKLDGQSMTVFFKNGAFGVCSRNLELKETPESAYWQAARNLKLEEKLRKLEKNIALQGELIGEGSQGNKYRLKGVDFYLFDIYHIDERRYLNAKEREALAKELEIKHCPVLNFYKLSKDETAETLLAMAEGKSQLNKSTEREGIVFKCLEEQVSFKAISNKFLLKNGD